MTLATRNRDALDSLRRRGLAVTLLWAVAWLLGAAWLWGRWPHAGRWAVTAAPVLAYGVWLLYANLSLNHPPGSRALLPTLGPGNLLTLYRGLAVGLLAGFLLAPWPAGGLAWLPMLLYTTADVADFLDGYAARRARHVTALGTRLDMEFDGLGMLVVTLLAVAYGQLPSWYLGLGLARYLFVLGLWWRRRRGLPVYDLPPSVHRRVFAGFQMGFMSAVLWPIVPPAAATIAGTLFAIPTALGFGRDWLVASGRLQPAHPRYQGLRRRVVWLTRRLLPPLLRLGLAAATMALLPTLDGLLPPPAWAALFAGWGLPAPAALATVAGAALVLAATLVVLGVAGRLCALILVFPLGFAFIVDGPTWPAAVALGCVICLMLLGSGPLALWQPEERVILRPVGVPSPVREAS